MKKIVKGNHRLTRKERISKLYRIDRIELVIGRIIMNILGGLIGAGLVLGFFWVLGLIMNWAERSTLNMIIFFVVFGGTAIKLWSNEFRD